MKWTPELDALLLNLRINHRLSTPLIAIQMGLSKGSVVGRLDRLKIAKPDEVKCQGAIRAWTDERVERVRVLRSEGKSSAEIGGLMGVTKWAVDGIVREKGMRRFKPVAVARVKVEAPRLVKVEPAVVPDVRNWPAVPLESRRGCAFPLTGSPMLYCNGKVDPGERYCSMCRRIMYTPRVTVAQKREANRGIMWAAR